VASSLEFRDCEIVNFNYTESIRHKLIYNDTYRWMQRMAGRGLHASVVKQVNEMFGMAAFRKSLWEVSLGIQGW
jgi:hypothetical protein